MPQRMRLALGGRLALLPAPAEVLELMVERFGPPNPEAARAVRRRRGAPRRAPARGRPPGARRRRARCGAARPGDRSRLARARAARRADPVRSHPLAARRQWRARRAHEPRPAQDRRAAAGVVRADAGGMPLQVDGRAVDAVRETLARRGSLVDRAPAAAALLGGRHGLRAQHRRLPRPRRSPRGWYRQRWSQFTYSARPGLSHTLCGCATNSPFRRPPRRPASPMSRRRPSSRRGSSRPAATPSRWRAASRSRGRRRSRARGSATARASPRCCRRSPCSARRASACRSRRPLSAPLLGRMHARGRRVGGADRRVRRDPRDRPARLHALLHLDRRRRRRLRRDLRRDRRAASRACLTAPSPHSARRRSRSSSGRCSRASCRCSSTARRCRRGPRTRLPARSRRRGPVAPLPATAPSVRRAAVRAMTRAPSRWRPRSRSAC